MSIATLMRPTAVRSGAGGAATPRSAAAACSGGITLISTPVPRSKPACVTRLGQMWMCQWYSPWWAYGAVWKPTL